MILLLIAVLLAGVYGAVHNQLSYSVSPEYFHDFKFLQFRIPQNLQGRVGASLVGWCASWWMGVVIGLPVLVMGGFVLKAETYFRHCLTAMGVVIGTTLTIGLLGLLTATLAVDDASLLDYWFPEGVEDRIAFARAGVMHDASYLGGILGIGTGMAYLWRMRLNEKAAVQKTPTH
jgi:hypothetical protein